MSLFPGLKFESLNTSGHTQSSEFSKQWYFSKSSVVSCPIVAS